MSNYYLSNSGNDRNNGLSANTPWKTINRLNSANILGNDAIYFKCNDTFYGNIVLPIIKSTTNPIMISSYGSGNNPKISAYKIINNQLSWSKQSLNIWKINLTDISKFQGNIYSRNVNIGFMNINGVINPNKKFTIVELRKQWDFYSDNRQYLYVYSTANPNKLCPEIKVATDDSILPIYTSCKVANLELVGSGAHGINITATNCSVSNCELHELGGSQQTGIGSPTRYGNGIEIWAGSKDILIENNIIYDVYDSGYTMQGNIITTGWENIICRNNTFYNINQTFEVFSMGNRPNTGFIKCTFENNICLNAGYCWSSNVRPDKESQVHLLMYLMEAPITDITIQNNVLYNPKRSLYHGSGDDGFLPAGYNSFNNYIFLMQGMLIHDLKPYKIEDYKAFVAATGKEKGSQFSILQNNSQDLSSVVQYLLSNINTSSAGFKAIQGLLSWLSNRLKK